LPRNRFTAFTTTFALFLLAFTVQAFPADSPDVTKAVRGFIDAFNTGDAQAFNSFYAAGDITIVDEFAPHHWSGPHASQEWAADYEKHAKATGLTEGTVKYEAPTRSEVNGDDAYVVVPTVYVYKEHGKATAEEGEMTFVLHSEAGAWKVRSWTWSGVKPHPAN
jgi:ketosteroid isomerase-like protein